MEPRPNPCSSLPEPPATVRKRPSVRYAPLEDSLILWYGPVVAAASLLEEGGGMMVRLGEQVELGDASPATTTGVSALGITLGVPGATPPGSPDAGPTVMTAGQYVASLSREFRALKDVPDDDDTVDFDPDI
jgi:hypothetical protein